MATSSTSALGPNEGERTGSASVLAPKAQQQTLAEMVAEFEQAYGPTIFESAVGPSSRAAALGRSWHEPHAPVSLLFLLHPRRLEHPCRRMPGRCVDG
jgi:hypothetical protein